MKINLKQHSKNDSSESVDLDIIFFVKQNASNINVDYEDQITLLDKNKTKL